MKTLAEHVQVACRNAKVTRQYFQKDAVLRHEQQSSQLVDILYNLNVVDFQLESQLSLDDAWPAFAEKHFGDAPPMATRTTAISASYGGGVGVHGDAVSLASSMHVDQGRSMEQLRERVATLRVERDAARDDAKASAEDKQEASVMVMSHSVV